MPPTIWPLLAVLAGVVLILGVVRILIVFSKCNDSVVGLENQLEDADRFQWMQTKISETNEKLDAGRPVEVKITIEPDQVLWSRHQVDLRELVDRARGTCVENNEAEDYDLPT